MHLTTDGEFGAWFETLHIAEPASLSLTRTVPAAKEFPLFDVVDEKAENVAVPATLPAIPRISTVMSSLRMARTWPSYASAYWFLASQVKSCEAIVWLCALFVSCTLSVKR